MQWILGSHGNVPGAEGERRFLGLVLQHLTVYGDDLAAELEDDKIIYYYSHTIGTRVAMVASVRELGGQRQSDTRSR